MSSAENIPERQAIAFQLDPISDQLLVKLGREAGKLMYSLADYPAEISLDLFGPIAERLAEINSLVEEHLRGRSFGLDITEHASGLTVASLSVPGESEQAKTLQHYTEWADSRSRRSSGDSEARSHRLDFEHEDGDTFRQAAGSDLIASLSVRCLGIRAKGVKPLGRDNLQIIDGGIE